MTHVMRSIAKIAFGHLCQHWETTGFDGLQEILSEDRMKGLGVNLGPLVIDELIANASDHESESEEEKEMKGK